jgi:hypothetical protein
MYTLNADGGIYGPDGYLGNWISPVGSAGLYEARATLMSGSSPVGTLNSWLALSTTRTWTIVDTAPGGISKFCTIRIEIRDAATSTVRDTADITLEADRT